MDFKKRIEQAMLKHHKKQIKTRRQKSQHPEQKITTPAILQAAQELGILLWRIEASTYNPQSGLHTHMKQAPIGHPDLAGIGPNGEAVFVELKAPGCRYRLRDTQRTFLIQAINHGAFACVTDSPEHFIALWNRWISTKGQTFLIKDLPPKPKEKTYDPYSEHKLF